MNINELAHGAVIAVADLTRIYRTDSLPLSPVFIEWALGDLTPGRFAWRLDRMNTLTEPAPCRGRQRLWTLPPDVLRQVNGNWLVSYDNHPWVRRAYKGFKIEKVEVSYSLKKRTKVTELLISNY